MFGIASNLGKGPLRCSPVTPAAIPHCSRSISDRRCREPPARSHRPIMRRTSPRGRRPISSSSGTSSPTIRLLRPPRPWRSPAAASSVLERGRTSRDWSRRRPRRSPLVGSSSPVSSIRAVSSSRTTVGQFWYALGLAGSTVLIDGLTRNAVSNKLGPSAGTELEQWSATGGKPSDSSVLPDAAFAFSSSFAVTMVVLAVTIVIAGVVAWALLKRFQQGDPSSASDGHPPAATAAPTPG